MVQASSLFVNYLYILFAVDTSTAHNKSRTYHFMHTLRILARSVDRSSTRRVGQSKQYILGSIFQNSILVDHDRRPRPESSSLWSSYPPSPGPLMEVQRKHMLPRLEECYWGACPRRGGGRRSHEQSWWLRYNRRRRRSSFLMAGVI